MKNELDQSLEGYKAILRAMLDYNLPGGYAEFLGRMPPKDSAQHQKILDKMQRVDAEARALLAELDHSNDP